MLKHAVQIPARLSDNLTEKLDRVMLHPWLGLPIFFAVMYLLFQGIFLFGQPLQTGVAICSAGCAVPPSPRCSPACP